MNTDNGSYSLIRFAGVGFFLAGAAGALLLAVRSVVDSAIQRRISLAMTVTHVLGGLIVWAQQSAIWGSPAGVVLTGWLWLAAASFAVVMIRARQDARRRATRVDPILALRAE